MNKENPLEKRKCRQCVRKKLHRQWINVVGAKKSRQDFTVPAWYNLILQLLTYCLHIRASLLASLVSISGIVGT